MVILFLWHWNMMGMHWLLENPCISFAWILVVSKDSAYLASKRVVLSVYHYLPFIKKINLADLGTLNSCLQFTPSKFAFHARWFYKNYPYSHFLQKSIKEPVCFLAHLFFNPQNHPYSHFIPWWKSNTKSNSNIQFLNSYWKF